MRKLFLFLCVCLAAGSLSIAGAGPLPSKISLRELDFPESLKTESPSYTLDSVSPSEEPGFLKFAVSAPHARYEVEGIVPFRKVLREIEVIEAVTQGPVSNYGGGVADSVKGMGIGLYKLVRHPVESVKDLGRAAKKAGQRAGGAFGEKEAGEHASWSEKVMGKEEREIAKKLGVDVYSTNPHVRDLLRSTAKARLAGKGTMFVATFFVPGGLAVSAAVTATGVNESADRLANDQSREDLFGLNQQALAALGFSPDEALELLNNQFYTPREMTYLRFYLEKLWPVPGYREVMREARGADSGRAARKILYEAQIAAETVSENLKPDRLRCFKEGLAFETPRRVIFITPYDDLALSPLGTQVMTRVLSLKKDGDGSVIEIWNGGKIRREFASEAFSKGVKTREWLFFKNG